MSQKPTMSGIQACVFDAYGTLFDVHSAVGKHRQRLGDIADQVSSVWRTKQLEYTLRSKASRNCRNCWYDFLFSAFEPAIIANPQDSK